MSVFFCVAHDELENSDFVGYNDTEDGEMCDNGAADAEAFPEHARGDREARSEHGDVVDTDDDGHYLAYDDLNSGRWDDDPSPYDGTYSEE